MKADCGFKKDVAILIAGQLVNVVNKRFGDNISPKLCGLAVKQFCEESIGLCCKDCGWRKGDYCTQRKCQTSNSDTCDMFRHVHVYTV